MFCCKSLFVAFFSTCILSAYGLLDDIQVVSNSDLGDLQYDDLSSISPAADQEEDVSVFNKRDIPSHTVARVRRQVVVVGLSTKVQGLTAKQECDGILLQWDKLQLPFSPNRRTVNEEFKHFNIYRSTSYFNNVAGMRPYVSGKLDKFLQNPGTNSYKDLYPPVDMQMYYAVTMVNGEGQEDKDVDAKKVVFAGAIQKSGLLYELVPRSLSSLGKVLHHSTAYNPRRNEYLVTFDFDVDRDNLPDRLFALRANTAGKIVDRKLLNYTANINQKAGNQGWPSVAYNERVDEYMIAFQFRAGVNQYFSNKYLIISQRVRSWQTEKAAGPALLVKANGPKGPKHWVDTTEPLIEYNSVTGGYVGAVILNGDRKEVVSLFMDSRGKILKSEGICSFKGNAYEPKIFFDPKRNEFFFACTVESGGVADADFNLQSGLHMVVITKRDANGAHASNTKSTGTKNFVGYTNKTLARTSGYYNEHLDRLILYWEDSDSGKHILNTASVFLTRTKYIREVKRYSCLATKQVRTPAAVYFPINNNHFLLWQEESGNSWAIGGELLQGNLRIQYGREQKLPVILYNSRIAGVFVTWQENDVVYSRQITRAARPLCSPLCTSQQRCAVQDTCVSNTGDSCAINNGGCSHVCTSLGHWKVQCSCPRHMQLQEDGKNCGNVHPCHGMTPIKNPSTGRDYFCGRGWPRDDCPANSYCHIAPNDGFAKCCPSPLPSYSVLVATKKSIWQLFMDTKQNQATFRKLQIGYNPSMLVALGYNPVDKRVYWSDVEENSIYRMPVSGVGGMESLFGNKVGVADGLTLDVEDDFIYWTEVSNQFTPGRIERANLNGRNRRTILSNLDMDKPRAIVLYKQRRLMYWTDWGATPKIERANLDGGDKRTLVQGQLKWPNGLVIDVASQRLFWADAGVDKIETSDLLGQGRRVLLGSPHVHHPYSLGILNNRLFWSDWETSGIHSVDKNTGKDFKTVAQGLDRPTAFAVFKATPPVDHSIRCPDPGAPANGNRHPSPEEGSDYPQGSVIRYTCFPHYDLHGPVTRTCLGAGSWSDKAPECLSPPRFQQMPTNKTVKETGTVLLRCTVSTLDTTIKWFKDGKVVKGDNFAITRSGLLFPSVAREDQGWYICNATNKGGSKVARVYLKVSRPLDADCGRPRLATRQRIVGGEKVEAGSFPWQVSLWNTRSNKHFCGGSLVAKRWVVTAAHCVASISVGNIEVRLGKLYTNKQERGREQLIRPDRIIIHPHYDHLRNDYDRDVALIYLRSSAVYTDYVRPICLPLRSRDADKFLLRPGNTGVITGWGGKRHHGRTLKRMHQVTVPVVNQTLCKISHKKYVITGNMFCAGHYNGTLGDACQGDSGGPLAIENSLTLSDDDVRWVLAGIISWGDGCGRIGKYGVYTRVSKFAGWINGQINKDD